MRYLLVLLCWAPTLVHGQGVQPRLMAGWGTNLLTSPGAGLDSSPGRTGYVGASITVGNGWRGKLRLQPTVCFVGSAYRTRMAYRAFFVTRRNSFQADLLLAFPQMNGATLVLGPFVGSVGRASALFEQGSPDAFIQGQTTARILAEHVPIEHEAGFVLGYSFPLGEEGRFGIDLRFRQHLVPLVEQEQSFALQFSPDQQVLATNTRASILSVGAHFRVK